MKYLIITVAGTATRFNRDTKEETLKCLYYTDEPQYAPSCSIAEELW